MSDHTPEQYQAYRRVVRIARNRVKDLTSSLRSASVDDQAFAGRFRIRGSVASMFDPDKEPGLAKLADRWENEYPDGQPRERFVLNALKIWW
jgi:hypothetical protein